MVQQAAYCRVIRTLNESPSEKEGKLTTPAVTNFQKTPLNESPSEKEGKLGDECQVKRTAPPSMKVPPKRKGNLLLPSTPTSSYSPQ